MRATMDGRDGALCDDLLDIGPFWLARLIPGRVFGVETSREKLHPAQGLEEVHLRSHSVNRRGFQGIRVADAGH